MSNTLISFKKPTRKISSEFSQGYVRKLMNNQKILEYYEKIYNQIILPTNQIIQHFTNADIQIILDLYRENDFTDLLSNLENISSQFIQDYGCSSLIPDSVKFFNETIKSNINIFITSIQEIIKFISENGSISLNVIDNQYDNLVTFTVNNYLIPMSTNSYENINNDQDTYIRIYNQYITLLDIDGMNRALQNIFYSFKAAVALYNTNNTNNVLTLRNTFLESRNKELLSQIDFSKSNLQGSISMKRTFKLKPEIQLYIMIYGAPIDNYDKYTTIKEFIKNNPQLEWNDFKKIDLDYIINNLFKSIKI